MSSQPYKAKFYSLLVAILLFGLLFYINSNKPYIIYEDKPGQTQFVYNNTTVTKDPIVTTIYVNNTETITVTPTSTGLNETDLKELNPQTRYVIEKKKYNHGMDYKIDVGVSSVYGVEVPYTGNGAPFLYAKFKMGLDDNNPFNDTAMLMYGSLSMDSYIGFRLCSTPFLRFWNWTVVPQAYNGYLYYWSIPTSDELADYFQNGENCMANVHAASTFRSYVCIEGDGGLTPSRLEEIDVDNDTKIEEYIWHVDIRDDCFQRSSIFPV